MRLSTTVVAIAIALLALSGRALSQTPDIEIHDLAAMASTPFGRMQVKAVVREAGSLGIAEMPAGVRQNGHHHEQEQIWLCVRGPMGYSVDGVEYSLNAWDVVITPSNTFHYSTTTANHGATFIEFQPLRRSDWLPPNPPAQYPRSAAPVPTPPGRTVMARFGPSSDDWSVSADGARVKSFSGDTLRFTVWDFPSAAIATSVERSSREQFAYVLQGKAQISSASSTHDMTEGAAALIAAAANGVRLRSADGRAVVALFERLR